MRAYIPHQRNPPRKAVVLSDVPMGHHAGDGDKVSFDFSPSRWSKGNVAVEPVGGEDGKWKGASTNLLERFKPTYSHRAGYTLSPSKALQLLAALQEGASFKTAAEKREKVAARAFQQAAAEVLLDAFPQARMRPEGSSLAYDYDVTTSAGPWQVSLYGDSIMTRFADPERAKATLGSYGGPSSSGKWNFHGRDSLSTFTREIRKLTAARTNPKKKGSRKRNPLYVPGGFEEPEKYQWSLPKDLRGTLPNVDPEGTDLSIWSWSERGKLYAVAFQGKALKHLWYHSFRSPESMQQHIRSSIAARRSSLKQKEATAEKRKAYVPTAKVGDIYYTSGGYDETRVHFFQIVKVSGKAADVRPVAKRTARAERGADYVAAVPGQFVGPVKRVRLTEHGFKVGHKYASAWDGKPKYETALGWGH